MKHEIDLSKYQLRTDLTIDILDNNPLNGIVKKETIEKGVKVTDIEVLKEGSVLINKKTGFYITLEFEDVTDYNNKEIIKKIFGKKLKELLDRLNIEKDDKCLIIGLGNQNSTPDSLGPLSVDNIIVTNHLFLLGELDSNFRAVSAIKPGVMGQTGIETVDIINGVVKKSSPDFVIVIDALASQSIERVNKTIQITDTGIHPGSGVGNSRKEISRETLGIPVIAIGIPTVVDAVTIVSDTINYMHKHFSYTKQNINNPINKLLGNNHINYLKKDVKIDKSDKENLFGMIGMLSNEEIKQLIFEVLSPIGYNLMVTPKEVDFLMEKLSDIIANGINIALHKKITHL